MVGAGRNWGRGSPGREQVIHRDLVLRMEQDRGIVGAAGIREGHVGRQRRV